MTDTKQRERKIEIVTADRVAPANPKSLGNVRSEDLRRDDDGKRGGNNRPPEHREQTGTTLFDFGRVRLVAAADLEHFGAGDSFRIRQVGVRDQGAAERNGIHDAENSPEGADDERDPEWKLGPPTDHDQTRQDKDD